ncbi:sigma factor-like helix-turn-helix DNA-binding protein [Paenibacillus bouchesdurhonensis]|uniref:sigma factor-like helix-turn-helix DNA-binding protein n=1 Tax=Paenibacillus bouchesdurhonensis TaxID=1870990 RepID=UPI0019014C40|nr:sigma factor-like helix-turn-helix DNA-binding protein [Paenibacillus bouchesdurhonensis]
MSTNLSVQVRILPTSLILTFFLGRSFGGGNFVSSEVVNIDKKQLTKKLERYHAYKFANSPIASLIEQAIDTLTDEEEQVVKLAYMSKKRWYEWEIAGELGVSDRTARRIKASALNKLIIALSERLEEVESA